MRPKAALWGIKMSISWRLPWKSVCRVLPEDMHPVEAKNEWVLWHDPDEWTEEFMAFVRSWDIDLGDLEEYALNHSKLPAVRNKVYR